MKIILLVDILCGRLYDPRYLRDLMDRRLLILESDPNIKSNLPRCLVVGRLSILVVLQILVDG
jgi:hypothetical protein